MSAPASSQCINISRSEFLADAPGRQASFLLLSVAVYRSSLSGTFLGLPTVLGTKFPVLVLLVHVELFLVRILVSDTGSSF